MTPNGRIHPTDTMTSRERLLAAYRGQPVDRLPYWAKVTNPTWRTSQPAHVRNWTNLELLDYIRADGLFGMWHGVKVNRPRVTVESKDTDGRTVRITHTPDGDLTETWALDPYTNSRHPVEFPIKTRQDIARYRWVYTDVELVVDEQHAQDAPAWKEREIGQRGVVGSGWGTSPLMHLVEHVVGPVDIHFLLADHPEEMDELIALMHAANLELVRTIARVSVLDHVTSVENTSTTLISPQQFERYCYRHLCDYGTAIEAEGKRHELHMCGHTHALLPLIDTIPASSIEAFTAPTLGNTRLVDGRTRAPSKTLIGGTKVNTWLQPVEEIQRYIEGELAACPDHRRIVLTTAGVAPPACPAETFRAIGEWIHTLPVRM